MPPTRFAQVQILRKRHEEIRQKVKRTREDLQDKIDSVSSSIESTASDASNDSHPSTATGSGNNNQAWYWEKLINILTVQSTLLENRMGAALGSSSTDFDVVSGDLDTVDRLVTEIRSKSCLP